MRPGGRRLLAETAAKGLATAKLARAGWDKSHPALAFQGASHYNGQVSVHRDRAPGWRVLIR